MDAKKISKYEKIVKRIQDRELDYHSFTPEQFKEKTAEFKAMFAGLDFKNVEDSKKIRQILDDIKIDAFALVKVAAQRID